MQCCGGSVAALAGTHTRSYAELVLVCMCVCLCVCAGEGPSVYQSCTHQPHPRGSMEGFFEFVEGTISQPTGPAFDVEASLPVLVCFVMRLSV